MSLYIENYGEKLCVIKGNVFPYKDKLKELKCKWNPELKLWYFPKFPKTNIDKIQEYIDSIGNVSQENKTREHKDVITRKEFLNLLSRVERLEQLFALKKDVPKIFEIKNQKIEPPTEKIEAPTEKEKIEPVDDDVKPQRLLRKKQVDLSIIYTDGCCNKETKDAGWGSVVNNNKIDLIPIYKHLYSDLIYEEKKCNVGDKTVIIAKSTDVQSQHNNYAELLAFVFALRLAKNNINVKEIKTDSDLIFKYWSCHTHDTKLTNDENKNKYIKESKLLRHEFENRGGIITKISGSENKADLGYHKD